MTSAAIHPDVSRGPGRIQRAIESTFRQNPSSTYSVDELAAVAYPGINQVEKKHRVAVLRAAAAAAETCGWWYGQAQRPGHSMIYGNPLDLRSYAIWAMRRDFLSGSMTSEQLAKALDDPKDWRSEWKNVQPGGSCGTMSRSIGLIERGTNRGHPRCALN